MSAPEKDDELCVRYTLPANAIRICIYIVLCVHAVPICHGVAKTMRPISPSPANHYNLHFQCIYTICSDVYVRTICPLLASINACVRAAVERSRFWLHTNNSAIAILPARDEKTG